MNQEIKVDDNAEVLATSDRMSEENLFKRELC